MPGTRNGTPFHCGGTPNPLQQDGDADGVGDACDACPTDPANDADSDGLCADADLCPIDPGNDADNDGFCADVDNCPMTTNPNQTDDDLDGIGNVCDASSATRRAACALACRYRAAGSGAVGRWPRFGRTADASSADHARPAALI